ncbi:MAG: calcium/sodium antiporter [Erysipelotrichaceae bacterium]|nr:calcium/sodium antiporter [Erysipelotrichaceae bacterium]
MILQLTLLLIGFVLLVKGADVLVEGASKFASLLHVPEIVIGLTIIAFGTSAPEAAVSITSAFKDSPSIAIGNVIGSNICNVLLVLGAAGTIGTLTLKETTYMIETPFVMIMTVILLILGYINHSLNLIDGIILWIFFLIFLCYLYILCQNNESIEDIPILDENDHVWKLLLMIILGIICVVWGSDVSVQSATNIAGMLGMSERLIGLTIVAFGTSLPELVTSVSATLKGQNDLAIGNIIGSCIFNLLFVLGTTAIVSPVSIVFETSFLIDGMISIISIIIFILFINKDLELRRMGAIVMLLCYIVYLVFIL